jgi:hypothetical protein
MTELNLFKTRQLSVVQYVLALHQPEVRVAVLVRNRVREQTMRRILSAEDTASSRFKIGSRSKIMQVPTCMLRGIELVFVYRAKNSAAALCLEGKKNLLRLQQDFPLSEAEANAVEDGVNALKSSSRSLRTFRLRRGPTPRHLRANSFRSNRRTEGAIDASGMGRL